MWSKLLNWKMWAWLFGVGLLTVTVFVAGLIFIVVPKLPSVDTLKDVQFQVPLRIYSRDEKLIAEYGEKKRSKLDIADAPKELINAVLAAEDDTFYEHWGVNLKGLLRAVVVLVKTGEKGQGGSTITMQVARNFFLSSKKTFMRKLNEILLSFRIEQKLTKDQILELYLNKIYLGNRSYGFAAASLVYYGKPIDELVPAQIAMLAGLPKAPSKYNPLANRKRAVQRRNYVLNRMNVLGLLDDEKLKEAMAFVDDSSLHGLKEEVDAPYVAEMVRSEMFERFKENAYTNGYKVYTSVDGRLQNTASNALRKALLEYTERHGFRGAEAHVDLKDGSTEEEWAEALAEFNEYNELWPAMVIDVAEKSIQVYQPTYGKLLIKWENLNWARPYNGDGRFPGEAPRVAGDIVKRGDIIRIVEHATSEWRLAQIPNVEGALVSLSPEDGHLIALVGGFNYAKSKFNRVLQAERQPGSNLKPFNYLAALRKGYTAASLINDAPVVFEDPGLESTWRPENYSGKVFGPTRLRVALMKSRNLVSIRLLRAIGIPYAIDNLVNNFGFERKRLPKDLSLALGSAAVTPMELIRAYAVIANGGFRVEPYFIDRIETTDGEVIFRANPLAVCRECPEAQMKPEAEVDRTLANGEDISQDQPQEPTEPTEPVVPAPGTLPVGNTLSAQTAQSLANGESVAGSLNSTPRHAQRVIPAQEIYILTSILQDVIKQGTAKRALELNRGDIAGKTGTTNDQRDAWFSGFSPDVATTAWVGFDTPIPLGDNEFGSRAALPMWMDFMREALKNVPERYLERPPGLVNVKIDPESGLVVGASHPDGVFEIFREDNVPAPAGDSVSTTSSTPGAPGESTPPENVQDSIF